jgi:UTP--glucose-1-phosphate uridylyltransferase
MAFFPFWQVNSQDIMKPIRKAIIPIAGYGTRLFPATKAIPKALFPIVDRDGIAKPAIQIIIEEALAASVEEICLVIQPDQREPIEAYFSGDVVDAIRRKPELATQADKVAEIGRRLYLAVQESQEGYGHAVYCGKDFVGQEPFLVFLGDHLYISKTDTPCARQLVDVYEQVGKSVTSIEMCHESQLHISGIVRGARVPHQPNLFQLDLTAEKPDVDFARKHLRVEGTPADMYLCNFGIDLLTPLLFDVLDYNYKHGIRTKGEIQLRDAMGGVMRQEGMYGYLMQGNRYDIGIPQHFIQTVMAFGLSGPYREAVSQALATTG